MAAKRVLIFAPHPDDAEFHAGGFLAKLKAEGADVLIVTATDGCCGTYHTSRDELAVIRRAEAETAAKLQGAEIRFLGYHDFELNTAPAGELCEKLVKIIREYRPDTVLAEDAYGMDEVHPDHRALAWASLDAINFAMLPNVCPDHQKEGLEPHFIADKYYYTEDPARMNCIIDISTTIENKMAGMMAHASQVEFLVEDVMRQAMMAGVDMGKYLNDGENADPTSSIRKAMLAQAAELGKSIGVAYAEGYHHIRFHPYVEALINK